MGDGSRPVYSRIMSQRSALVVVVDGLRASALGAYGNATYPTPALDELAAGSILFDWCYAPTNELAGVYQALWHATHSGRVMAAVAAEASLPRVFRQAGYATTLIADEPSIVNFAAAEFGDCVLCAQNTDAGASSSHCDDVSKTAMNRLFAAASHSIAAGTKETARLVWIHARGMYGVWDAPVELQQVLLDEGEPAPVHAAAPPDFLLGDADDPDVGFRYACAYAAQVMVLDSCWDMLMDALRSAPNGGDWLVILLGARGFPLGEHRRIGGSDGRLFVEQLHVPWLVYLPNGRGRLSRSTQLVSHFDVPPTLVDWMDQLSVDFSTADGASVLAAASSSRVEWRDALIAISREGSCALRTQEWCLRQAAGGSEAGELYVRPDDRWEANDVAKLCPNVVDKLTGAADNALQLLACNQPLPRRLLADDVECD
jgi:arylsulfatase A-like enzyme